MGLPESLPLPAVPFSYPSFETPRWTPIPPRLPEIPLPEAPYVEPRQEVLPPKPVPRPMPQARPPAPQPLPPKPVPQVDTEEQVTVEEGTVFIELPIIGEFPVPSKELIMTAGTTAAIAAAVSVIAALSASWLIKFLMKLFKPTIKFILKKVLKKRNKFTESWGRKRLAERLRQHRSDTKD